MGIMDKLKKNTKLKNTAILDESKMFNGEMIVTEVPMINVALAGSMHEGLRGGLGVLAGPSKHFKTSFALMIAAAYMQAKPKSVMLFYDSEFGSPQSYFDSFGIDSSRVLHTPITNIEEFKFDLVGQLEGLDRTDEVIIVTDSIGNLASKKELEDAKEEKSVADMSRAKALKGLFRMVTPYLKMKDIPMLAINHTYKEIGLFPKDIVGGGTGIYYSADWIWIIGRRQNKKGTEVLGYDFIIKEEKSRMVKEQSKIPISVSWEGGILPYSGLLDIALASGHVVKPSNGFYSRVDESGQPTGKKVREAETKTSAEFWEGLIEKDTEFSNFVESTYKINSESMINFEEFLEEETI